MQVSQKVSTNSTKFQASFEQDLVKISKFQASFEEFQADWGMVQIKTSSSKEV